MRVVFTDYVNNHTDTARSARQLSGDPQRVQTGTGKSFIFTVWQPVPVTFDTSPLLAH